MRELTRTNDPVFLSYLQSELGAEGIEPLVLDGFASSVLEPMNVTALQRVMVGDDDYWRAWAVLEEAEERISEDTILDGRMVLLQPKDGFRAAIDPIVLAACVPAAAGDRVLDVGTGSGAAAFALLAREPWAWVTGIDIQANLIALAARSAVRNDLRERACFQVMDVAVPAPQIGTSSFDHVMSNPPFLDAKAGQRPKDEARALATIESTADLVVWLAFMTSMLRDGGTLNMIHRADRLDEIVAVLDGGFGAVRVLDLVPVDDGRPIKRCVVQAEKGAAGGPLRRTQLVLHESDGAFTAAAQAILRDAGAAPIS